MNKTLKIVSLVAAGFIVIGVGLGVLGAFLGGGVYGLNFGHGRAFPLATMEIPMEPFSKISVNGNYMELILTPSQADEWKVTTAASQNTTPATAEVIDGVLYVTTEKGSYGTNQERVVTITYPSQTNFAEVDVALDAAEIDFYDFSTDNMMLSLAAGDITMNQVVAEKSNITVKAGALDLSGCTLNNAITTLSAGDLEANAFISNGFESNIKMGSLSIDGDLTGTTQIKVATGDVELNLAKPEKDYALDLRVGTGEIDINGRESFRNYTSQVAGANPMTIDVKLGSMEVDFIN